MPDEQHSENAGTPEEPVSGEFFREPSDDDPEGNVSPLMSAAPSVDDADANADGDQESFIENTTDPWRIIEYIRAQDIPLDQRGRFLPHFYALIARETPSAQDALISAGLPIFRYRTDTARREIKALVAQGAGNVTKFACFINGPDFLAEVILPPREAVPAGQEEENNSPVKYLAYKDNGEIEILNKILLNDILYLPPQSKLITYDESPKIVLPTGLEEYGDDMELYREVLDFINSYVYIPNSRVRVVAALYVFVTWIYDRCSVVPYLRAIGDSGHGKSRLLKTLGQLVYRGMKAGGATTASPIFRIIERFRGTLIIDEADFGKSELWDEIVKILNQGYEKGDGVLRSERTAEDNFDVTCYDVYGPKILGTRKRFDDEALESRCFTYRMIKVRSEDLPENIPLLLDEEFYNRGLVLRNKLLLWRLRRFRHVTLNPRERVRHLDLRLNQIVLPLLASTQDEELRSTVLDWVEEHQRTQKVRRAESETAIIARALVRRASSLEPGMSLFLKSVIDQLDVDHTTQGAREPWSVRRWKNPVNASKQVAELIRDDLGLTTRKDRKDKTVVEFALEDLERLCSDYGMDSEILSKLRNGDGNGLTRTPVPPAGE